MAGVPAVEVADLTVRYRRRVALDAVSMRLSGGIVGVLGPNGAGKTSLLSVLATVSRPDAGRATVHGRDVSSAVARSAARELIGWLPQRFDLSGSMTVQDTVAYAAWSHGVPVADCARAAIEALSVVDLEERATDRVRRLSGGQRQRLGLAAAIAHEPPVLLLDEPTVGLDPSQRVRLRHYLRAISTGRTIIVATHLIEDGAQLCDELVVLRAGTVAYHGSPQALADSVAEEGAGEDGSGVGGAGAPVLSTPLERAYERLVGSEDAG
ncbi:ABC transporter ATP-binding protein [Phytoactinopolyspora halophila]|uniref:ABC transporter ATP-binding protein n=1 Tax=Phytoactinopolyspora halophila TaxID=1981511 RepID=UPI001B8AD0CD|nr:ATP-binding cassette domain-containing protein [Phytoactinopolyspora halophila]